ncbi:MAG: chromophore lyase CpcT/CpeT, partial [Bacteroidota bacterium]
DDNTFSSAVYTLEDEKKWIGKWKTSNEFNAISRSDLVLRDGCAVILKRLGKNHYKGSTGANSCKSSLRGASYATSEVEIKNNTILSWDRGMDADGNQVWGAEKGGYIFKKIN